MASTVLCHGLVPSAPFHVRCGFSIRAVELYRVAHNRSPHLSINAFIKTLCDLQGLPFKTYLSAQFSIAYDLYLRIRMVTALRVDTALLRDKEDDRLRNACPPCMYRLEGEEKLEIKLESNLLYTIDGGNSLKRVHRRELVPVAMEGTGSPAILAPSSEAFDNREVGRGMYLSRAMVDTWSKEALAAAHPDFVDDDNDDNPCAERWSNMKSELTSKMWGIFDETGLFLSLCRHGFVLLLADMVHSGEL